MAQNIVWISLESTRYDHTSLSDYHRDTTPFVENFASRDQATSFDHCITHGKWTGTSTASILTGTHPPTHGVYGSGFGEGSIILADEIKTIPEMLPEDYTTCSLISNSNAGPAKGLDRGFDTVREFYPSKLRETVELRTLIKSIPQLWAHGGGLTRNIDRHKGLLSYMTVDAAKRFVSNQTDPYYLFLHFNSSHQPYLPPYSYRDTFVSEMPVSSKEALDTAQSTYEDIYELISHGGLDEDELDQVTAMYDAVLSHVDYCVAHLVESILQEDDDTIVVITGDHGDLLGEYDLVSHKFVLHDALIHVPLVTYGLDGVEDQSGNVVQHIDVVRTIFSQIGIDHEQLEGLDLTDKTREYAVTQRCGDNVQKNLRKIREYNPEYTLPRGYDEKLTSVRSKTHKLLYTTDTAELFLLPDESTDVKSAYEEQFKRMKSYAEEWLEAHDSGAGSAPATKELDESIRDHLSDMGYLV
jgi:uncharacterized sulfatase